jgi:hypothetical protein
MPHLTFIKPRTRADIKADADIKARAARQQRIEADGRELLGRAARGDVRACTALRVTRQQAVDAVINQLVTNMLRMGATEQEIHDMVKVQCEQMGIAQPAPAKPVIDIAAVYDRLNNPAQDERAPAGPRSMSDIASRVYGRE